MNNIKSGDIQAMSLLFQRHKSSLYGFFYRMNRDTVLCEDLTQNVFERMIKYRSSYDPKVNFKSWMFSIAKNVNYDHYRKKKIHVASEVDHQNLNHHSECADRVMDGKENLKILESAMDQLDHETKQLITLTRIEKLKYTEVAEMFNVSEGTIKVRVHRGLKKLKNLYLETYGS